MNNVPPSRDQPDDADERYRRASALDPSKPSEAVRQAILAHAAQLAADTEGGTLKRGRPAVNQARRRPAILGTLAAAVVAALVVAPWLLTRAPRPQSRPAPLAELAPEPAARLDRPAASAPAAVAESRVEARASRRSPDRQSRDAGVRAQVETSVGPGQAPALAKAASPAMPQGGTAGRRAVLATAEAAADPAAAFRRAAEEGDLAALQALREKQSNVDSRDLMGRTALMLATLHGQTQAVNALLEYGADPNAADAHGTTPLQAALAADQAAIAAALQRYGAR